MTTFFKKLCVFLFHALFCRFFFVTFLIWDSKLHFTRISRIFRGKIYFVLKRHSSVGRPTQEKITLFPHYNFTFHFHCTVLHTNNFTNQVNFAAWNLNFNWKFAWTQLDFDLSYYQSLYSVSALLCVTQIFVRQKFWALRKMLHVEQIKIDVHKLTI